MDDFSCKTCKFNQYCPCGYSKGNAACLTIRANYEMEKKNESFDICDTHVRATSDARSKL